MIGKTNATVVTADIFTIESGGFFPRVARVGEIVTSTHGIATSSVSIRTANRGYMVPYRSFQKTKFIEENIFFTFVMPAENVIVSV